ncbi:MAG: hypothetical protein HONBIEJF_02277 [Fimbriimonadaceae bacterium]|nr:hypothetical protein [Fimbriimonadaceae bacterium]
MRVGSVLILLLSGILVTQRVSCQANAAVREARSILDSRIENNWRLALEMSNKVMNRTSGINETNYPLMWKTLIAPRMKDWKQVGGRFTQTYGPHQTVAHTYLRSSEGLVVKCGVAPFATEQGMRNSALSHLWYAWFLEFTKANPSLQHHKNASLLSQLAGIRKDRAFLEKIGIKGIADLREPERLRSWGELERRSEIWLAGGNPGD